MGQHGQILKEYRAALEKRKDFGIAAPLSLLPYSKTEIKSALKAAMRATDDPEMREQIKLEYITLADFIPDQVAEIARRNWEETAAVECETEKEGEVTVSADAMDEVVRIQKGIADEGAQLTREIQELLKGG
jgi:hypothetical protein